MSKNLTLPLPAEMFIPHRPPMQLVETLISYGDGGGVVEARPKLDCPLVNREGELDRVALVELLAQGYAVVKGYDDVVQGRSVSEGFLVGVKKFAIKGTARAGDLLLITVKAVGSFEGFAVVEGKIERAGETIASGSIKLWIVDQKLDMAGA